MQFRRSLVATLAVAAAAASAGQGAAATVPCQSTLTDASGASWPINSGADPGISIDGMTYAMTRISEILDPLSPPSRPSTLGVDTGGCWTELGGRQIVFAPFTTPEGLELSRKVYVPSAGKGFARVVDTIRNPTNAPFTRSLRMFQLDDAPQTFVDGSPTFSDTTQWYATKAAFPHAAIFWGNAQPMAGYWGATFGRSYYDKWVDVTVPAGGQVSAMQVIVQGAAGTAGEATVLAEAARIADMPKDLLYGMTTAELTSLVNWNVPSTNTDGDKVIDAADRCPTVAGTSATGCDVVAPVVTVSAPTSMTRAAFLKGVPVSVRCNEACSARVRLIGRRTAEGRLLSTMRVLLAHVTAPLGTTTKRVVARPYASRVVSRTSFTAYVKVMATDATGNITYVTKRITVA
jgi:hypothetical protein